MKKLLVLIIGSTTLTFGCASGPMYGQIKSSIPPLSPDNGRIFFYRRSAVGAAIQPSIRLNDQVVGKAKPQGVFYVDSPPGNYKVETKTEVTRTVSFTLDKAQTRYVRFGISLGFFVGHVYPELVEDATGESEIGECHYIGLLPQVNLGTHPQTNMAPVAPRDPVAPVLPVSH